MRPDVRTALTDQRRSPATSAASDQRADDATEKVTDSRAFRDSRRGSTLERSTTMASPAQWRRARPRRPRNVSRTPSGRASSRGRASCCAGAPTPSRASSGTCSRAWPRPTSPLPRLALCRSAAGHLPGARPGRGGPDARGVVRVGLALWHAGVSQGRPHLHRQCRGDRQRGSSRISNARIEAMNSTVRLMATARAASGESSPCWPEFGSCAGRSIPVALPT